MTDKTTVTLKLPSVTWWKGYLTGLAVGMFLCIGPFVLEATL